MASLLRREAESRIVVFVSEHDDDAFAPVAELGKPTANQLAANLPVLMIWQNGERSQ